MAQVLIPNLDGDVIDRLKARAKQNGISLEQELQAILTHAVKTPMEETRKKIEFLRKKIADTYHPKDGFSDIADLLREDRD